MMVGSYYCYDNPSALNNQLKRYLVDSVSSSLAVPPPARRRRPPSPPLLRGTRYRSFPRYS